MPSVVGILLDLSESMKYTVFEKLDLRDQKRSRSIFTVLDELIIKEDILPDDKIFAIGCGTRCGVKTADLIGTIKQFQEKYAKSNDKPEYSEILLKVFEKIEEGSCISFSRFLSEDKIKKKIPYYLLSLMLDALYSSDVFLENVISCLPSFCRADSYYETAKGAMHFILKLEKNIDSVVKGLKECFFQCFLRDIGLIKLFVKEETSVYDYNTAAGAVRYWFEGKNINDEKIQNVLQTVEPFLYGKRELPTALQKSLIILEKSDYSKFKKYLFVLSDGQSDDRMIIDSLVYKFREAKVKVVSCYVSNSSSTSIQSKRLYTEEGEDWLEGAKSMFRLSSIIKTHVLPYVIFKKAGWSIDTNKNETKLFLQVNHPDHIYEVCNLAKQIMSSKDALLELLGSISLSSYIKKTNKHVKVTDQKGKSICYAHAVATVFHLAMKRIINRVEGYPNFEDIKNEIVTAFGEDGACISSVLNDFSEQYNMHYEKVDSKQAIEAIASNRPVIVGFALTDPEWAAFKYFFETNPSGILTKKEIDITKRGSSDSDEDGGHAAVLTSLNSECFLFMSSWGEQFGDKGFFRVQNQNVFDFEFYDVYWTDEDLQPEEEEAYKVYGVRTAQKLVEKLRGLNSASFICPICQSKSPVSFFTGTFEHAICPECESSFDCREVGHTLAINLYFATLLK